MATNVPKNQTEKDEKNKRCKIFSNLSDIGIEGLRWPAPDPPPLPEEPFIAMVKAPTAIIAVPIHNFVVKWSSFKSKQLKIELKMSPMLWSGDKIINGKVEIWTTEPKTLAMIKRVKPKYHILRLRVWICWCWYSSNSWLPSFAPLRVPLWALERWVWFWLCLCSLSIDNKCDFLCNVIPKDCTADDTTATLQPMATAECDDSAISCRDIILQKNQTKKKKKNKSWGLSWNIYDICANLLNGFNTWTLNAYSLTRYNFWINIVCRFEDMILLWFRFVSFRVILLVTFLES